MLLTLVGAGFVIRIVPNTNGRIYGGEVAGRFLLVSLSHRIYEKKAISWYRL